jgi:hypothetical protein
VAWNRGSIDGLGFLGIVTVLIVLATIVSLRKHVVSVIGYLVALFISVFFSFDSLYGWINPPDQRTRESVIIAGSRIEGVITDVSKRIVEQADEKKTLVVSGRRWEEFKARTERVASAAERHREEIDRQILDRRNQARIRLETSLTSKEQLERQLGALEARRTTIEASIPQLQEKRRVLEPVVKEAQRLADEADAAAAQKRIERDEEARSGYGERKQGKGPDWRRRDAELAPLAAKASELKQKLAIPAKQLRDLEAQLEREIREQKENLAEIAKLKAQVGVEGSRVQESQAGTRESVQESGAADLTTAVKHLKADLVAFPNVPTADLLKRINDRCLQLLADMRSVAQVRVETENLDCGQGNLAEPAAKYFETLTGQAAFLKDCNENTIEAANTLKDRAAVDAAAARVSYTDDDRKRLFVQLTSLARRCLALSKLEAEKTKDLRAALDQLELAIDPEAKNRLAANAEAFRRGDVRAFVAGVMAAAMDALVLAAGIFGAAASTREVVRRPGTATPNETLRSIEAIVGADLDPHSDDPPEVRNCKVFLKYLEPLDADAGSQYRNQVNLDRVPAEDQAVVRQLMSAGPYSRQDSESPSLWRIDARLVADLYRAVRDWQERKVLFQAETTASRPWRSNLAERIFGQSVTRSAKRLDAEGPSNAELDAMLGLGPDTSGSSDRRQSAKSEKSKTPSNSRRMDDPADAVTGGAAKPVPR